PRDRVKALRAVRESGGAFVSVPDSAILAAIPELAQYTGVFAEPAAAATLAGLREALRIHIIQPEARIVLLVTGSRLHDLRSAMRIVGAAYPVENSIAHVSKLVAQLELATI